MMFDPMIQPSTELDERESIAIAYGEMLDLATRIIGVFVVSIFVGSLLYRAIVGGF
jgi:hypothetical protein